MPPGTIEIYIECANVDPGAEKCPHQTYWLYLEDAKRQAERRFRESRRGQEVWDLDSIMWVDVPSMGRSEIHAQLKGRLGRKISVGHYVDAERLRSKP